MRAAIRGRKMRDVGLVFILEKKFAGVGLFSSKYGCVVVPLAAASPDQLSSVDTESTTYGFLKLLS